MARCIEIRFRAGFSKANAMKMGSKDRSKRPVLHLEVNNRTKHQSGLEERLEDLVSVVKRSETIQSIINNFGVKVLLF